VIEEDQDPTPEDYEETRKIEKMLDEESNHETNEKRKILAKLSRIVVEWVKQCGRDDGKDEDTINNSGGAIFTFGSFRLGVAGPGADIDTLCVAPKHI